MSVNRDILDRARNADDDEFYTRYETIEWGVEPYKESFYGKVVYCNCDNPCKSNFVNYFVNEFDNLGLRELIVTGYEKDGRGWYSSITDSSGWFNIERLSGNGDYRSAECMELLQWSDIVVTNPPFSLFRHYLAMLLDSGKQFLIIGNLNTSLSKNLFPRFVHGEFKQSVDRSIVGDSFIIPGDYSKYNQSGISVDADGARLIRLNYVRWYTNLPDPDGYRVKPLEFYAEYTPQYYQKFDNCDAINVNSMKEIPDGYYGVMGVPCTIIDRLNYDQFKILGINYKGMYNQTKVYKGVTMYRANGTIENNSEGRVNANTMLKTYEKPVGKTYYTAAGEDGYLLMPYRRIFIKRKR